MYTYETEAVQLSIRTLKQLASNLEASGINCITITNAADAELGTVVAEAHNGTSWVYLIVIGSRPDDNHAKTLLALFEPKEAQ